MQNVDEMKKKIGNGIKNARKEAGMSRKQLSDSMFVTEDAVKKWERGVNMPAPDSLLDVSRNTSAPLLGLFGLDDDEAMMTEYPFFFTEDEKQVYLSAKRLNPDYPIEIFWVDVVIPHRKLEKGADFSDRFVAEKIIKKIFEEDPEHNVDFSNVLPSFRARLKDCIRSMRNLEVVANEKTLSVMENETVLYEAVPKDCEHDFGAFVERMIDDAQMNRKKRFSTNEIAFICNRINEISGYRFFEPVAYADCFGKDGEIIVKIDVPLELFIRPCLSDFVSQRKIRTDKHIQPTGKYSLNDFGSAEECIEHIFKDVCSIARIIFEQNCECCENPLAFDSEKENRLNNSAINPFNLALFLLLLEKTVMKSMDTWSDLFTGQA